MAYSNLPNANYYSSTGQRAYGNEHRAECSNSQFSSFLCQGGQSPWKGTAIKGSEHVFITSQLFPNLSPRPSPPSLFTRLFVDLLLPWPSRRTSPTNEAESLENWR